MVRQWQGLQVQALRLERVKEGLRLREAGAGQPLLAGQRRQGSTALPSSPPIRKRQGLQEAALGEVARQMGAALAIGIQHKVLRAAAGERRMLAVLAQWAGGEQPAVTEAPPIEDPNAQVARQGVVLQAVVANQQLKVGVRGKQCAACIGTLLGHGKGGATAPVDE
jgi:hypothetical protein